MNLLVLDFGSVPPTPEGFHQIDGADHLLTKLQSKAETVIPIDERLTSKYAYPVRAPYSAVWTTIEAKPELFGARYQYTFVPPVAAAVSSRYRSIAGRNAAVVGRSRTPSFTDAPDLPYIQAIIKEVLRWRPVLPFSLPHTTAEDDWYNGMFIPKGL